MFCFFYLQIGSLMFVVRDFEEEESFGLGLEGGKKFVKFFLDERHPGTAQEHIMIQDYLKCEFENISCCLLPNPSKKIKQTSFSISGLCYFIFFYKTLFSKHVCTNFFR